MAEGPILYNLGGGYLAVYDENRNELTLVSTQPDRAKLRLAICEEHLVPGSSSLGALSFNVRRADRTQDEWGAVEARLITVEGRVCGAIAFSVRDEIQSGIQEVLLAAPHGIFCNVPIYAPNLLGYGSKIALRAQANDRFLCADDKGDHAARPVIANRDEPRGWETFTLERPR